MGLACLICWLTLHSSSHLLTNQAPSNKQTRQELTHRPATLSLQGLTWIPRDKPRHREMLCRWVSQRLNRANGTPWLYEGLFVRRAALLAGIAAAPPARQPCWKYYPAAIAHK